MQFGGEETNFSLKQREKTSASEKKKELSAPRHWWSAFCLLLFAFFYSIERQAQQVVLQETKLSFSVQSLCLRSAEKVR